MRYLALTLVLAGCAISPSQVSAPGKIGADVLDHWTVSLETGWLVPLVLEERAPRRSQLGGVVTWREPF